MSIKKLDPNKLAPKKGAKKTDVEKAVNTLHPIDLNGDTVRTTIDIPGGLHKEIKRRIIDTDDKTIKEYFMRLAKADLAAIGITFVEKS